MINSCASCNGEHNIFRAAGWVICPACRYEIKCDDCRVVIGHTDDVGRSAQGGFCALCSSA